MREITKWSWEGRVYYENRKPLRVRLRSSAIVCSYSLQFEQQIVRWPL